MRKISAILLALLLLLSITACGGNEPADSSAPLSSAVDSSSESSLSEESTTTSMSTSTTSASITTSSRTRSTTSSRVVITATTTPKRVWYTKGKMTITKAEVDAIMAQTYTKPKNVIVMIADGMGPNDITITEKYSDECFEFGLLLNQFKNHGEATTRSADAEVTDSAASATALATGTKTNNGMVGMLPDKTHLKNISEIAREQGKKIGIVTNDLVTGATPSGYTVHAVSREATAVLAKGFVDFAPDVLIGQGYSNFVSALTDEYKTKLIKDFLVASTFDMMPIALNGDTTGKKPLIGFHSENLLGDSNNYLAYCTELALNRLDGGKGFFLLVEGAGTDKAGHSNVMSAKINNVITFERAIAVVLKYMKSHPDTLLVITSDHETGGVQLPADGERPTDKLFTTTNHTGKNVRVFALGYGAQRFRGRVVDNTDIAKFTISAVKGELE